MHIEPMHACITCIQSHQLGKKKQTQTKCAQWMKWRVDRNFFFCVTSWSYSENVLLRHLLMSFRKRSFASPDLFRKCSSVSPPDVISEWQRFRSVASRMVWGCVCDLSSESCRRWRCRRWLRCLLVWSVLHVAQRMCDFKWTLVFHSTGAV